jgi:hypothetical protein
VHREETVDTLKHPVAKEWVLRATERAGGHKCLLRQELQHGVQTDMVQAVQHQTTPHNLSELALVPKDGTLAQRTASEMPA